KESGTGLGLLVIKKVMDKHKGRVAIQSAVGQGTTVDLIFPRNNKSGLQCVGLLEP
ncbi:MAG: hypothetical protein KBG07_05545, partial [Elusimicrobia bacterium]|nr:hypothetical protein [Elusimicrobiota bacterium]